MTTGLIFDVKRYAINDGPGIRTAVFFKGCPLNCWWCHNPEGQSSQVQLMFRPNRCKAFKACIEACPQGAIRWEGGSITDWVTCDHCGKCALACFAGAREMIGRNVTSEKLMDEIARDIPFYNQSGGGVTFTGGEPMSQREFMKEILTECKNMEIHTAVDTSGYTPWEGFEAILPHVDLFLYDLKMMDQNKHMQYTSVSNNMILENLRKLSVTGAHIIVRIPFIPGVNDDHENVNLSAAFLAELPHLDGIELMPYHEIGLAKYQGLGMEYRLGEVKPVRWEAIKEAEQILIRHNLPVKQHNQGRNL